LYGCGDLITDYEGIEGHEEYRGDLGALYLAGVDPSTGQLQRLKLVPTSLQRFRLVRPAERDVHHLASVLHREGARLSTDVGITGHGRLQVEW
jgi:poly-gamma-glutamate synthesis protein (capsule biosynthesis protein)